MFNNTNIIQMIPDEVRIYPDGSVVEIYGDRERLVTNPFMARRYREEFRDRQRREQEFMERALRREINGEEEK